jgi:DNA-binding beta-propeller fold protein YncE
MRIIASLIVSGLLISLSVQGQEAPERATDRTRSGEPVQWPGLTPIGRVLLPNGWSLQPAGRQVALGDFPVALAEHPTEPVLAILHAGYGTHEVILLDTASGRSIGSASILQTYGGLAWSPDGKRLFVGGGFDQVVYVFEHEAGLLHHRKVWLRPGGEDPTRRPPRSRERAARGESNPLNAYAGLAVSADGTDLWVANAFGHKLERYDAATGAWKEELELGKDTYPYGVVIDPQAKRVYASLWGGAAVAVVDLEQPRVLATWAMQEHPNEMLLDSHGRLFVANANRNTVSVIDTKSGQGIETLNTAIDPRAPSGSTPASLALTPDGSMLFVANANTNDLAVFNVKDQARSTPLGLIPTGWYPTSVRVARDGKTLFVANGKGGGSKSNRDGPRPGYRGSFRATEEYIGGLLQGSLSIVPLPGPAELAAHTRTVYACCPLQREDPTRVNGPVPPPGHPIPRKPGDPSPITHVVYIIKENRTYDQVFGDIKEGNGDPQLCLFPEAITPNHHALAREFVLLDNFYVEAEVSADGHEWTMGAYATDFVEKTWPLSYRGDRRIPYPSEGNLKIAEPAGGYLWDRAAAKGVTYRSYGEFVQNGRTPDDPCTTKIVALQGHFDPWFRSYDLNYKDVDRARRFLSELAEFEKTGEMPRLIILRLPNDHTSGTRPGAPTVQAMLADNDLALGQVVEGLSRSRFWNSLAIFVVEDDAQNGSDHVDAHRTVALAISPFIKRGSVDSTLYSTSSMLRTMELILGLDPMSQFDAAARPMDASFTATPDFTPYRCRPAGVDLNAVNPPNAPNADLSLRLDLDGGEDRADDLLFNWVIWQAVRGPDSVMPPPVRAAFVIPRSDEDSEADDD